MYSHISENTSALVGHATITRFQRSKELTTAETRGQVRPAATAVVVADPALHAITGAMIAMAGPIPMAGLAATTSIQPKIIADGKTLVTRAATVAGVRSFAPTLRPHRESPGPILTIGLV